MLPGCHDPPAPTWADLFEIRDTVVLSSAFAARLAVDNGLTSRLRLTGHLSAHVSATALRAGRLEPVRTGDESAILSGLAPFSERLGASLLPKPRALEEVPYWVSLPYEQVTAQGGGRIVVASNLFYPIFIFDHGQRLVDSLVVPPASWQALRRTRMGEFSNDARGDSAFARFLESFSMILGMAVVGDSVLVVNHAKYRREADGMLHVRPTFSDVYVNGMRVATDLPSPGDILAYSHGSIFFLAGGPPGPQWRIVEHRWRNRRQRR
jgi:hypothetical protein